MKVLFFILSEYTFTMKFARISIKIFLGLAIIFSLIFTLVIGKNQINQSHAFGQTEKYKGIITVWHIDTFEGGTGSRKQFLLKAARSFEKRNQGVLVMVIEHTEESMKEQLKNNKLPDLVSFGAGVELNNFNQIKVGENNGGAIGEKTFATPWCRGGYVLIANPKLANGIEENLDSLLVSQGEYTQPLAALYLEGINASNITVKSPFDAYVEFVSCKIPYFLGTQRDINRLERRQMEIISRPLKAYNDIFQYIAVTSKDSQKVFYAESFIEHLLTQNVQESLNEIGMLSCQTKVKYDNQHLVEMQELSNFSTVSAFADKNSLIQMQENSLLLLNGDKALEIKIKNMLV